MFVFLPLVSSIPFAPPVQRNGGALSQGDSLTSHDPHMLLVGLSILVQPQRNRQRILADFVPDL